MKKFTVKPKLLNSSILNVGGNCEDEYINIGRLAETGPIVNVKLDIQTPHVIGMFGKRGSGKSYALGSLIEGLCVKNKENSISKINKDKAVVLFDTLGIFQWMNISLSGTFGDKAINDQKVLQRGWDLKNEDLQIDIITPKGTNTGFRQYKEFTIDISDFTAADLCYLLSIDLIQDRMGQLINEIYEKVVNDGWHSTTSFIKPNKLFSLNDLLECAENDKDILSSFHSETRRSVIQQLNTLMRNPIFGTIKNDDKAVKSLRINDIIKKGSLCIVLLHKLTDSLRLVLILSIIRKIMQGRIATSELEKNLKIVQNISDEEKSQIIEKIEMGIPPTWIIADEAQNFLPSEKKTSATETIIKLVREGRNYGLSFVFTTQQPTAIDQRILSQVDTIFANKLTVQNDIDYIKTNLKSALPSEVKFGYNTLNIDELFRSLDIGQAIVSNTESDRAFILEFRPRVSVHGGFGF